ncbi:Ig-like domain-containing protein [Candidatus Uhrbacteria bacterium]|nr:Ig-like domain-containing protein [Candidatus Uhrbacteria bacterium]
MLLTVLNRLRVNTRTLVAPVFVFVFFFILPIRVYAQTGAGRGWMIAGIIMGVLAIAALILATWALFQYRKLPADDPTSTRMRAFAIIGGALALVFFILLFVFLIVGRRQSTAPSAARPGTNVPSTPTTLGFASGGIERHVPRKNAEQVPRNTAITMTFRETIDPGTLIDAKGTPALDDDVVRQDAVTLRPKSGGAPIPLRGRMMQGRTLIARPESDLGSATAPTAYVVEVTSIIQKKSGGSVLPVGSQYQWTFTTGTALDALPPRIVAVRPTTGGTGAPNSAVQVIFSEPIDPTTVGLTTRGKSGLTLLRDTTPIEGSWILGPDGTVAEFLATKECGTNACGVPMYCLPEGAVLTVVVNPATVAADPPHAVRPFDGIVDMAGNSLDGNGNGRAEGASDTLKSSFTTLPTIDRTAPFIVDVRPGREATLVGPTTPVEILFSKPILTQSVHAGSLSIEGWDAPLTYRFADAGGRTRVSIDHDPFPADRLIAPVISGAIQDTTQNCYQPCIGP